MDIAAFVIAVVAAAAAVALAFYAWGANTRADRANRMTAEALDLQKRIDARAAEFSDVRWEGSHHLENQDGWVFTLRHRGLTSAANVTLVVDTEPRSQIFELGTIEADEDRDVVTGPYRELKVREYGTKVPWRVFWTSPLGTASKQVVDGQRFY
ncbi:hypothetical protein GCM10022240_06290 [Microbacterium kribbense]|uniref:Uncharacterized protein n=1 Tax=Microbacterium kribbense TaxID=433645 RepID=A0ABP7GAT4_9MICO